MAAPVPAADVVFRSSGPDGHSGGDASIQPDRTFWRYYFAGQVLAGCLSTNLRVEEDARLAVEAADALIAELEREPEAEGE